MNLREFERQLQLIGFNTTNDPERHDEEHKLLIDQVKELTSAIEEIVSL